MLNEALNLAYHATGLPIAYAAWETSERYLFFMIPEDIPTNQKLDMGSTLIAVSKSNDDVSIYDIFDHSEEFSNAKRIDTSKGR